MIGSGQKRCQRCRALLRRGNDDDVCDPCARVFRAVPEQPRLPPNFHEQPEVAAALRRYDFGRYFKAVRAELGLTQEEFGQLADLTQSRVCKIENGQNRLRSLVTVARIVRALGTPVDLLGFGRDQVVTLDQGIDGLAVDWLERRDFISAVTAIALGAATEPVAHDGLAGLLPAVRTDPPARIGLTDVVRIEATTRAFRDWDNRWGGGLSRAAVIAQLHWVIASAKGAICTSEAVQRRLLTATADLANVAAFMSYDVERQDDARRLWLVALDACREAHNVGLAGSTLRQLAHQALHLDRPDEALSLIRLVHATTADPDHEAAELALAETAAYQGWCYAATGNVQACHRALGQSEDYFASTGDTEPPPWLEHIDLAELNGVRGHSYHVLAAKVPAAARRARPLLNEAIEARGPEYPRGRTLNLIALAATYFQQGDDIEAGIAYGRQALDGVSTLNSPRALARLDGLRELTEPYAAEPGVAEYRSQLQFAVADAA